MNRTDPTAEPSMEEILASIRSIISDDHRSDVGQDGAPRAVSAPRPARPSLQPPPEEDVLDLTDEFVFPEDAAGKSDSPEGDALPSVSAEDTPHPISNDSRGMPAPASEQTSRASHAAPSDPPRHPEPIQSPQPAPRAAPSAPRPVWSRREYSHSPMARQGARPDPSTPRQPKKSWTEDIQLPIPEQGPVSLFPSAQESKDSSTSGSGPTLGEEETAASGFDRPEEVAVAALAEKIARSAVGAMDSDELRSAQRVDFERIATDQKADVSEKFADAIQSDAASREADPLPTLLDEVLRQEALLRSHAEGEATEPEAAPSSWVGASPSEKEEAVQAQSYSAQGSSEKAEDAEIATSEWQATQTLASEQTAEVPMRNNAPAQARFAGAAQPSSAIPTSRAFEEAVRDMLRPLLVQWLNEHMPRILENAIREEIATRGLLSKPDDSST